MSVRRVNVDDREADGHEGPFWEEVNDDPGGTHALLPWLEHQAMVDVVETVEDHKRTELALYGSDLGMPDQLALAQKSADRVLDALDALRKAREVSDAD